MTVPTFFHKLLYGGVQHDFYTRNIVQLRERNVRMLTIGFAFASMVGLLLLALASVNEVFRRHLGLYIGIALWFVFWLVAVFVVLRHHHCFARFFYAVLAGSVLTITAVFGSYLFPDMVAVVFFVFLIFIPGLYVDKPYRCMIVIVLAALIFIGMVLFFKTDRYIIYIDIVNTIFCMLVSVVFNLYSINVNLQNIESSVFLKQQSMIDELTGLPNRRCFNRSVEELFRRCQGGTISIIMMDIDFFKRYNDNYGHLMGDECLAQVGKSLHKTAQTHDLFVARYGGEEFVAIDCQSEHDRLQTIANAFVRNIAAMQLLNENSDYGCITLSAGYAGYPSSGAKNYMQLINFADAALYDAKSTGRNRSSAYQYDELAPEP